MSSDQSGSGGESEKNDDIRARFPDPEAVRIPGRGDLPEPPRVKYTPPTLPEVQPFRRGRFDGPDGGGGGADLRSTGIALTIGIQLFAAVAGGVGLGLLVDRYLLGNPATPWGLIGGFFLGTASGVWTTVRLVKQLNREP